MHSIREIIVVEGRYDKNALSQVVDAVIIETSGFGIFNDAEKRKLLPDDGRSAGTYCADGLRRRGLCDKKLHQRLR